MARVQFYAGLRQAAGCKEADVPGATVAEVLQALVGEHPALGAALFHEGRLSAIIILNGRTLDPSQGLETALNENDAIAIFPPISGG